MVAALVALSLLAVPAERLPEHTGYVVDAANRLTPTAVAHLRDVASRLDHAGIAQIAVATIPPEMFGDTPFEQYAVDLFKKWKLGHGKQRADGVLILFVAGPPGQRHQRIEVGYGLEGVLNDGKVGALLEAYSRPSVRRDDYSAAAVKLTDAVAGVLEKDAAAGGDAAPGAVKRKPVELGGFLFTVAALGAAVVLLLASSARRAFPGRKSMLAVGGAVAASIGALSLSTSAGGWIALVVGLIVIAVIWASIAQHRCPKDGSWMVIDEEIVEEPTYFSEGLKIVRHRCTNAACGYRRTFERVLPRRQVTVVTGGGGGRGGWGGGGGGGGDGFSGGGGGESGGGGASRTD